MNLYACHNKPRSDGHYVKDGMVMDESDMTSRYRMRYIKDFGSRECRYDCKKTDARCEGCER